MFVWTLLTKAINFYLNFYDLLRSIAHLFIFASIIVLQDLRGDLLGFSRWLLTSRLLWWQVDKGRVLIFRHVRSELLSLPGLVSHLGLLLQKVEHPALALRKLREVSEFILPEWVHVDDLILHSLAPRPESVILALLEKLISVFRVDGG